MCGKIFPIRYTRGGKEFGRENSILTKEKPVDIIKICVSAAGYEDSYLIYARFDKPGEINGF
jgi:hypothetical protein